MVDHFVLGHLFSFPPGTVPFPEGHDPPFQAPDLLVYIPGRPMALALGEESTHVSKDRSFPQGSGREYSLGLGFWETLAFEWPFLSAIRRTSRSCSALRRDVTATGTLLEDRRRRSRVRRGNGKRRETECAQEWKGNPVHVDLAGVDARDRRNLGCVPSANVLSATERRTEFYFNPVR